MVRSLDDDMVLGDAERMLDSMPVEAVLIDGQGKIVAVNAHWDRFAQANGYPGSAYGLGTNYLSVCLGTGPSSPVEGRVVAEGLNDVLSGRADDFSTVSPATPGPSDVGSG